MATVTAEIKLTSAAGDLVTDALSLADSTTITVTDMATTGLARTKVVATAVHSSATVLYTASDFAAPAYLYVKNTDATPGDYIFVYDATTTGDPVILKLAGGDWAFLPLNAGLTLKAYATTNPTLIEWMVFGTDA
jgi:hypothetical protein|tara:strand:- start:3627 stop:4031 length:405 start_codon:yes stop_codon:yes gene_type:complete